MPDVSVDRDRFVLSGYERWLAVACGNLKPNAAGVAGACVWDSTLVGSSDLVRVGVVVTRQECAWPELARIVRKGGEAPRCFKARSRVRPSGRDRELLVDRCSWLASWKDRYGGDVEHSFGGAERRRSGRPPSVVAW